MTCAKVKVVCKIITMDGVVEGENSCQNPQSSCPRTSGEGYEKCLSICGQEGHAEIMTIRKAQKLNYELKGSVAIVYHYNVCKPCSQALREVGVGEIIIKMPVDKESITC